jgi:hypothetical protein
MRSNLFAAAAVALAMSAMPAMAQDAGMGHDSSPVGEGEVISPTLSPNLGIDLSAAGETDETRMAFYNAMPPADQQSIKERCEDEALKTSFTSAETAFCGVTQTH